MATDAQMAPVKITEEMRALANEWAKKLKTNLDARGKNNNYTQLDVSHRWVCGYLGELVFKRLLDIRKKKYNYEPQQSGFRDHGDFTLFICSDEKKVDVKTACLGKHMRIMMPKIQFDAYDYDFYIAVRLTERGEVWGWLTKKDFELNPEGFDNQSVPTMFATLNKARDIETLLEICD